MITREEALAIFKKYNIQVEETADSTVYKVINNDQEVNIDALEFELKECILLISRKTRYEKDAEGYGVKYAPIYYILLDYDNDNLMDKYEDISRKERRTLVSSFKYNPNYVESIDTIYRADEIRQNET